MDPALRRRFHKHVTFGAIDEDVLRPALAYIFPDVTFTDGDIAALGQGPPLMMSDLATAAEMLEIGRDETPLTEEPAVPVQAAVVVGEILSNARSRDRTRGIGF